jgi:hypothetical protein
VFLTFRQNFYPHRNPPFPLNAMDYPAGSNDSSDYEGFRNPPLRSNTTPVVVGPRYPASHVNGIDSLRPASTICYGSATKYLPSRSYPSANAFNTNASTDPNASSIEIGDYTNAPTFMVEPDGDMCFEPEAVDAYYTTSNMTDFNQLPHEWPSLNDSIHATGSLNNNYSTNFAAWPTPVVPWFRTSGESSVREVRAEASSTIPHN